MKILRWEKFIRCRKDKELLFLRKLEIREREIEINKITIDLEDFRKGGT